MSATVLVTESIHPDGLAMLRARPGLDLLEGWRLAPDAMRAAEARADALLVRFHRCNPAFFARAARVRIVARHGVGVDLIEYVASLPRPSVVVVQDLDDPPGFGAMWGEVNTAVHLGLGAVGVVTNGSVCDLDQFAPGFQALAGSIGPSHAYGAPVSWGEPVDVHGMTVCHGDLVHADRHGAVVIPTEVAADEIH